MSGAPSESRYGKRMKSGGLLLSVGISFAASAVAIVGCIVAEKDTYPDDELRPPGGNPSPASGSSGGGGTGSAGATGSVTGGTGGGTECGDGKVEGSESCDDRNQADGDGCTSTCQVEECWECPNNSCMPLAPTSDTLCNEGTQVCDGKGGCRDCVPIDEICENCKSCAGSPCSKNGDCASMVCVTGICRSATGSTCADAVECASDYCSGGSCALCTDADQCPSGSCNVNTGQCYAAIGEPCEDAMPCGLSLDCTAINICKGTNGVSCEGNHQCVSNRCSNMLAKCNSCDSNTECGGDICDKVSGVCGTVTLPNGAYCVNSDDCASSNCTGFPRRCAPP